MDDKDTQLELYRKLVRAVGDFIGKAETRLPTCKFCGSANVVRNGHRKGTHPR